MATQQKILLLDDDEQMLDLYKELLGQIPSQPEVRVCSSGARAIAMLESEPFNLLITDLRMPKMDGLQVLSIVRRKYPQLRLVVLTSVVDEEYRSRAYAQGVELFWQKPANSEEVKMFQDCVESLLGRDTQGQEGFRGVQNKSLVDLIQLECLSRSSAVLRITQGSLEGKIWVHEGDIIDSTTGALGGEAGFREILSWKGGNFEILPADPDRPRTIMNSYQGLLLDTAQAMDEAQGMEDAAKANDAANAAAGVPSSGSRLAPLAKFEGVEFVFVLPEDDKVGVDSWGLSNAEAVTKWAREAGSGLIELGANIQAGQLLQATGTGLQRHWSLAPRVGKGLLCVGFRRVLSSDQVQQTMKLMTSKWAS